MDNFISYRIEPGTTIEEAWAKLQALARKAVAFNPSVTGLTTKKERFSRLLRALPEEYSLVRISIDASKLSIETGLAMLQEEEFRLFEVSSTALAARQQRSSKDSSRPRRQSPLKDRYDKCYLCGGSHRIL